MLCRSPFDADGLREREKISNAQLRWQTRSIHKLWLLMVFDTHIFTALLSWIFFLFSSRWKLGCVKIVNYYSHDPSIGRRRKSFNRRILMAVQIVSRVAHAIISENAQRAIPRRKHWSGSDRWVMFRWPVKRQIRLLSQVNLHSFLILYLICAKLNCVLLATKKDHRRS